MKTIAVATLSKTTPPEPMLEHAIRNRAYELYVQRGRANGHAVDDWLKAEAELVHGHSTSDSNNSGSTTWLQEQEINKSRLDRAHHEPVRSRRIAH
jgi:hypothetical protein